MSAPTRLRAGEVRIRHITTTADDRVAGVRALPVLGSTTIGGLVYYGVWEGLNDRPGGFESGQYELRLSEEGQFTLTLPNAVGGDGRPHRDRFAILAKGHMRALTGDVAVYEGGAYRPGDEWIEVYSGGRKSSPDFIGTPTAAKISPTTIEITGYDPLWTLRKVREGAAAIWTAIAPRDLFELATRAWAICKASDFSTAGMFTFSTSVQSSADGWSYRRVDQGGAAGAVRLRPQSTGQAGKAIISTQPATALKVGLASAHRHARWRVEAVLDHQTLATNSFVTVGLYDPVRDEGFYFGKTATSLGCSSPKGTGSDSILSNRYSKSVSLPASDVAPFRFAIEGHGRWAFFYYQGALVAILPMSPADSTCDVFVDAITDLADGPTVELDRLIVEQSRPYLLKGSDLGDYHLPGAPPPGGLYAEYFNDAALGAQFGANQEWANRILTPDRVPALKRIEKVPDIGDAAAGAGIPGGDYWSLRMSGSIYLDLANFDYRLRLTNVDDVARLWVGKTRQTEELASKWDPLVATPATVTTVQLRSVLGLKSGWYPLIVEAADGTGGGTMRLEWERSDSPNVWTIPSSSVLSPLGVFRGTKRIESHYDILASLRDDFGLQFRVDAQQLESGLFPAEVIPRVRAGEDYDEVMEDDNADGPEAQISAADVADAVIADAQGLADGAGAAQITARAINFAEADRHLFLASEYESAADVTNVRQLEQRLGSWIKLRGGTWEELGLQPDGERKLVDRFPLLGTAALLKWLPGDGLRARFPLLGIDDQTPRPLKGIVRPFFPGGLARPEVSFRSRRRDDKDLIRGIYRTIIGQTRNYQGQLAIIVGNWSSATVGGGGDVYSRINLPEDLASVIKAVVVVQAKGDTSAMGIEVNGTARLTGITRPGRYDVTPWIARSGIGVEPRMYTRLTGGTGTIDHMLELTVRI